MSEAVRPLYDRLREFIREAVKRISAELEKLPENTADRWSIIPAHPEMIEKAKVQGHSQGWGLGELLPARGANQRE
ncbi:hypothetical protein XI06_13055 [Bradyrhizobium sp. CCBAU 11434]|uniref:hypothetical protein n=1 Tax=Bradyrhizobium sp. CCBAU 11434 TaxID=1630885 RepID=UPI00230525BC|nr:hypothetical protein [Bradyrhizobium sp. CCBAU 11434]MDA9521276.1 hypothetical protein [Bradyrhizobium sp. CCBAU 11434]